MKRLCSKMTTGTNQDTLQPMKCGGFCCGVAAVVVLLASFVTMTRVSADDSFLDQAIPVPPEIKSSRYLDHLQAIAPVVGKKTVLPPGLADYLSIEKPDLGMHLLLSNGKTEITKRDYLNQARGDLGLDWKYDAAQDAVVLDFAWHQPDSRPAPELVVQLLTLSPVPMKKLMFDSKRKLTPLDPWRVALNGLMSTPENYPHTWKVRLADGCCGMCSLANSEFFGDSEGIFTHVLKDAGGTKHLLVLNYHAPLSTPGPNPSLTYYLFSGDGRWEDGGLFEAGTIWMPPAIRFDEDHKRATLEMTFKPLQFTDTATGKVTTLSSSYHTGDKWDYFLEIRGEKLSGTLFKNGNAVGFGNDAPGVTPLRHLGE